MKDARCIGTLAAGSTIGRMADGRHVAVHPQHPPRVIDPIAGIYDLPLTDGTDLVIDPATGTARWNSNMERVGRPDEKPE